MHHYEPGPKSSWRRDPTTHAVLVVEPTPAAATPLRRVSPDFSDITILSSPNAVEALDRLDDRVIGAVAVDVDTANVHGIVLLQVLAKLYPAVIRIALATPMSAAGRVASGLAHQVIEKPVDPIALSLILATSLEAAGFSARPTHAAS